VQASLKASGNVWAELNCKTGDRQQAASLFRDEYNELPEYVEGKNSYNVVVGACEVCGGAIFEDENYEDDTTGILWHKENCEDKRK